jgi:nitrile hydratase
MNGIHDLGGMHGFGAIEVEHDEPVFHGRWEGRVLGMVYQMVGMGWSTIDGFRHGIERTPPLEYLRLGYYGRWLAALERVLVERGVLAPGEVEARRDGRTVPPPRAAAEPETMAGAFERSIARPGRFAVGDPVRVRVASPAGHTRLPRYAAGRRGLVVRAHGGYVYPDTNALGLGEDPQYLYTVRFDARELWGADAEPEVVVHLDLFEPYLEPTA